MIYQPMEIVINRTSPTSWWETMSPIRRIYTDGRGWPKTFQPAFDATRSASGDTDGDGRTTARHRDARDQRPASGGRSIPLHEDDQTVVKERISLDKSNPTSCATSHDDRQARSPSPGL